MQCSVFQSLLDQAIESHSDSVSLEVQAHGSTCSNPACAQAWIEHSLLSRVVPDWQAALPQVDLTTRVLAELSPPQLLEDRTSAVKRSPAIQAYFEQSWHDLRSPQQRPWSIALSVAGVMLLIGMFIISVPHSPDAELVVRPRNNPVLPATRDQWASRNSPSPNVAVQSIEWVQKASSLMATTIVSIPEKGADWVPDNHWEANWQRKLEPLRRDAHAVWDTLLDKLPLPERPAS